MALERIGLGAVLQVDSQQLVQAVEKARSSMERYLTTTQRANPAMNRLGITIDSISRKIKASLIGISTGLSRIGSGLRSLSFAAMPLSIAIGLGAKKAAEFEKQMSAVGAVTRANQQDMVALTKEAKKLGIESVFTATQAGQGMELLGRAGANTQQIMDALSGVMNAASADSIDLATSADIVAQVVKGMGLKWKDASHIADTLALASSKTNTNIIGLGEAFKYGVSQARAMGVPLEELTAIFGKIADAGLKGSLGGTALTNMLTKLAKPTSKGQAILDKFNIRLTKSDGSLRKISAIVEDFTSKIAKIPDAAKKAKILAEVFGRRGVRAFNALSVAGAESVNKLEEQLKKSSLGIGVAAEMAEKRLDNFLGKFTLFTSSIESLSIAMFGPLLKTFTISLKNITLGLNNVLFAMQDIDELTSKNINTVENLTKVAKKYGVVSVAIALGIQDAINLIKNSWIGLTNTIKQFSKTLKDSIGIENLRILTKWITIITLAAGAVAPFMLSMLALKFAVSGVISILSGLGMIASAVFWPVIVIAGVAFVAFQAVRKENETILETIIRVWGTIKNTINDVYTNVLKPFWLGIKDAFIPIIQELGVIWSDIMVNIRTAFNMTLESFNTGTSDMEINWKNVGSTIANVIGSIAIAISTMVKWSIPIIFTLIQSFRAIGSVINTYIITPFKVVYGVAKNVFGAVMDIYGPSILEGLYKMGTLINNQMIFVFNLFKNTVVNTYNAITKIFSGDIISGLIQLGSTVISVLISPFTRAWLLIKDFSVALSTIFSGSILEGFVKFNTSIGEFIIHPLIVVWDTAKNIYNAYKKLFSGDIIGGLTQLGNTVISVLISPFTRILNLIKNLSNSWDTIFGGSVLKGFSKLGTAITDYILLPIRTVITTIIQLADKIPGTSQLVPKGLREFTEKGFGAVIKHTNVMSAKTKAVSTKNVKAPKILEENKPRALPKLNSLSNQLAAMGVLKAKEKGLTNQTPNINVQNQIEDKRIIDIVNRLYIDGDQASIALSKHKQEIKERSGTKDTPWQRGTMHDFGVSLKTT